MKSFAFSDLNRQSGEVLDAALAGPVTLTKHGKPKVVMMSIGDYERLTYPRAYSIHDAPDDVIEELLAGLDAIVKGE
ncbi:MAG: type II toxin-antitoxin system Phd/YefM family antitoxin [Rhizobiaceae bacterium]